MMGELWWVYAIQNYICFTNFSLVVEPTLW